MSRLISVVLPCYNVADYVEDAVASMLAQTFGDLEVIAIDDGSTDGTLALLEAAAADARVRVLVNDSNIGLIRTLQRGVDEARGAYIARMDADDWSHPRRLEAQLELLDARPDVDVVGAAAELMHADGTAFGRRPVRCVEPVGARFLGYFAPPVVHPSLLARAEVMRRHRYRLDPAALHTEDYDLFARMLSNGVGFANVDAPLIRLRVHAQSVSRKFERIQIDNFITCSAGYLERMTGVRLAPGVHKALVNRIDGDVAPAELGPALKMLDDLRNRSLLDADRDAGARLEIERIGDEQRLDILVQALTKGGTGQRLAAARLAVGRLPSLVSGHTRRYLGTKLRRARQAGGV